MKKIWLNKESKIIAISLIIYALNKAYMRRIIKSIFLKNYFNDALGGIVLGAVLRIAFRYWFRREIPFSIYIWIILFAGIYWEYVAPLYLNYLVSDVFDIAAYLSGGFILQLVFKIWRSKDEV